MAAQVQTPPQARLVREGAVARLRMEGDWLLAAGRPDPGEIVAALDDEEHPPHGLRLDAGALGKWDFGLLTYLSTVEEAARARDIPFEHGDLPEDAAALLQMASEVPDRREVRGSPGEDGLFARLGKLFLHYKADFFEVVEFTGECVLAGLRLVTGRSRMRRRDLWLAVQDAGASALPIVSLISILVGFIIAFLGAVVLQRFGASIFVSYLMGYGMLREMGAVMTGIILAGRTGAAYAAQIGSMKVSEEIDALKVLAVPPMDFLVLPRLLALFFMMPLLVLYSNLIGILGGLFVAMGMLELSSQQYFSTMTEAVGLLDLFLGLFKGTCFGLLVGFSGCLRGMQSGRSADDVGRAATSAVVTGITLIIFVNTIIDWLAALFGI